MVEYRTAAKKAEVTLFERKSKFIGRIKPVQNTAEAEAFIEKISKKHWDATHNVPAYIIGVNGEIQKYSDANEPSGTAGLPVLESLKQNSLVNVAVVVTRYFGGTLLGRGGLIRAYGRAAREAINKAGIVRMVPAKKIAVTVDYSHAGKIENELINRRIRLADTEYLADVTFHPILQAEEVGILRQLVQEYTANEFVWVEGDQVYLPVPLKE